MEHLEKQDWAAWFKLPQEERDAIKRERRRNAQRASAAAASAKLQAMGGGLAPAKAPPPPPAAGASTSSSGRSTRRQRAAATTAAATDDAGGLPLPPELVPVIFSHLYSDLRDDGGAVVGPCAVALDIANAALACRGFAAAARDAMADVCNVLGANLAAGTSSGADGLVDPVTTMTERQVKLMLLARDAATVTWAEWEALLASPASCKLPQLKKAAKALWLKTSGTKAELIVGILGALELPGPARLPLRLWRACVLERCMRLEDTFLRCQYAPEPLRRLVVDALDLAGFVTLGDAVDGFEGPAGAPPLAPSSTLAEARAALAARGVRTVKDLRKLEMALDEAHFCSECYEDEVGSFDSMVPRGMGCDNPHCRGFYM